MATNVIFNNISYPIPAVGDTRWGLAVSNFLISLGNNALSKAGGNFNLTADVNFGTNYGLIAKYLKSGTADIAQSGVFRLANIDKISFRNAGNTADIPFGVNVSNQLEFNGSVVAASSDLTALTTRVTTAESNITTNTTNIGTNTTAVATKLASTGGTATGLTIADYEDLTEVASQATPTSGKLRIYAKADHKLYQKDSTGTESLLGGGGLTPSPLITVSGTSVNGITEEFDTTAGAITRTLPVTTLAASIDYNDATGACNATNYLRITPGAGDKLNGYTTSDSLVLRRRNVSVRLNKAAGSTTWYITYQTVSLAARASSANDGSVAPRKGQAQMTVTSTLAGWSAVRSSGIYYQDQDGAHRLKFNIYGTMTAAAHTTSTFSFANVTFKAGILQACSAGLAGGTVPAPTNVFANASTGNIVFNTGTGASNTSAFLSGDVELESKPTWA